MAATQKMWDEIQAINDTYNKNQYTPRDWGANPYDPAKEGIGAGSWGGSNGGGYNGTGEQLSRAIDRKAQAEADVMAVLRKYDVNTAADLVQGVKGSHNDQYPNLGVGNGLYERGREYNPEGGTSRDVEGIFTKPWEINSGDGPIGSYSYTEAGKDDSFFNSGFANIVAGALAPWTAGLSVAAQKALAAADGTTLHTDDYAKAAAAVAGNSDIFGVGGEVADPTLFDVVRGGYNGYRNLQDTNTGTGAPPPPATDPEAGTPSTGLPPGLWESMQEFERARQAQDAEQARTDRDNQNREDRNNQPPVQPTTPPVTDDTMTQPDGDTGGIFDTVIDVVRGVIDAIQPDGKVDTTPTNGGTPPFNPNGSPLPTDNTGGTQPPSNDPEASGQPSNPFGIPNDIWDIIGKTGKAAENIFDEQQAGDAVTSAVQDVRPRPYNMNLPGVGGVSFNDGKIGFNNMNENFTGLTNQAYEQSLQQLQDPQTQQLIDWSAAQTNQRMPEVLDTAMNTHSYMGALDQFNEQNNALMGQGNSMMDNIQGSDFLGQAMPLINEGRASADYQDATGRRLIEGAENYQGVADERLGLLREMADPYEQRSKAALEQRLFNSGNIGSKAGAVRQGEQEMNMNNADRARILDSQTMADALRRFDINAGTNLFQGGTAARGTAGSLFGSAAASDASTINSGNAARSSIYNTMGGLAGQGLEGNLAGIGAENSRVRNRLTDLQNLFNFGQDANTANINNATNLQNMGNQNIQTLLDMTTTAANPFGYSGNPYYSASNIYSSRGTPSQGTDWSSIIGTGLDIFNQFK